MYLEKSPQKLVVEGTVQNWCTWPIYQRCMFVKNVELLSLDKKVNGCILSSNNVAILEHSPSTAESGEHLWTPCLLF